MIKGACNMVVDWIKRLCNMTFERGLNVGIIEVLVCVSGKIYAGILVDRVRTVTVTGGLIDDE